MDALVLLTKVAFAYSTVFIELVFHVFLLITGRYSLQQEKQKDLTNRFEATDRRGAKRATDESRQSYGAINLCPSGVNGSNDSAVPASSVAPGQPKPPAR